MELTELRQTFLEYFQSKGYHQQPAASLLPDNDPSVLFTTAGMQQFKPYYLQPDQAPHQQVTTVQPVVRTSDIAEVGDATHLTMFEMLGNFRFGEVNSLKMKQRAIAEAWELVTKKLHVSKDRVFVTVFAGDNQTPADTEAEGIWQSLGVEVKQAGREDNFWGPTGDEGPCGPTSEIYIDGIEVWNLVFNQYHRDRTGNFTPLTNVGLDTGSGLERLATTLQKKDSVWEIEPFSGWLQLVDGQNLAESRIIIDHLRAIVFLVSEGVVPANKGREYILRRLIRKVVFLAEKIDFAPNWLALIKPIAAFYASNYPIMAAEAITDVFTEERERFNRNLTAAIHHLEKWLASHPNARATEITDLAFYMYESFGFPKELLIEHLTDLGWAVDNQRFATLFVQHQQVSRAGLDKQFKGGLADHGEQTIKHHTAHHLLLAALRQILGPTVVQRGSNVTTERLRLDFSFDRKLTEEELREVAEIVNDKIRADLPVVREELPKEQALASGALAEFGQKYGDTVSVYSIGDFSKELCGGPHVAHTGQLGEFTILKEEASSQGVRRIKARVD